MKPLFLLLVISNQRYDAAVTYLKSADPSGQAIYDKSGYYAVAEDLIVLPGVYPSIEYDKNRDWEFPGTSDAVIHSQWQAAATKFASKYNGYRKDHLSDPQPKK